MFLANLLNVLASGGLVVAATFVMGAIVWNIRRGIEEKDVTPDAIVIWIICGIMALGAAFGGIMMVLSIVLA